MLFPHVPHVWELKREGEEDRERLNKATMTGATASETSSIQLRRPKPTESISLSHLCGVTTAKCKTSLCIETIVSCFVRTSFNVCGLPVGALCIVQGSMCGSQAAVMETRQGLTSSFFLILIHVLISFMAAQHSACLWGSRHLLYQAEGLCLHRRRTQLWETPTRQAHFEIHPFYFTSIICFGKEEKHPKWTRTQVRRWRMFRNCLSKQLGRFHGGISSCLPCSPTLCAVF